MCLGEYNFMNWSAGPLKAKTREPGCIDIPLLETKSGSFARAVWAPNPWTVWIASVQTLKITSLHISRRFSSTWISAVCSYYWKWLWNVEISLRYNKAWLQLDITCLISVIYDHCLKVLYVTVSRWF